MFHSGLEKLAFLVNTRLNIVSAGEIHDMYNIKNTNSAHSWLNYNLIQNAKLIVEDLYYLNNDGFKTMIPKFFKPENTFSADDIRESCYLISEKIITEKTAVSICAFLATNANGVDYANQSYDISNLASNVEFAENFETTITTMHLNNIHFDKFIINAKTANSVFSLFDGNEENHIKVINTYTSTLKKIIDENPDYAEHNLIVIGPSFKITDKECFKTLLLYEVMFWLYIKRNFTYYVTNWIARHNPQLDKDNILKSLCEFLQDTYKYIRVIQIFAALYDFNAIIHLLKIYDNTNKQLVWICAGSKHNDAIISITTYIFNQINDPLTETAFDGIADINQPTRHNINSAEFVSYINEHPEFGFRKPIDTPFNIMRNDKNILISDFEKHITTNLTYVEKSDINAVIVILHTLPLTNIQALITMVLTRELYVEGRYIDMQFSEICRKLGLTAEELVAHGIFSKPHENGILHNLNDSLWKLYLILPYVVKNEILPYTLKEFFEDRDNLSLTNTSKTGISKPTFSIPAVKALQSFNQVFIHDINYKQAMLYDMLECKDENNPLNQLITVSTKIDLDKLSKVYKSYETRCTSATSASLVENLLFNFMTESYAIYNKIDGIIDSIDCTDANQVEDAIKNIQTVQGGATYNCLLYNLHIILIVVVICLVIYLIFKIISRRVYKPYAFRQLAEPGVRYEFMS